MSRQDKATTDRNARTLRELVKQPDNKACADCRKNDARWAAWNLGVYLCIRCSGIHRSMGTHISKVKSIDLDIWTPEQMEKWGNKRANLYWERHLKAGHVPPDHKIESFIRSKYESKRWAMDGPPPSDPSVLEQGSGTSMSSQSQPTPTPTSSAPPPAPASLSRAHPLLSRTAAARPSQAAVAPAPTPAPILDLFGDDSFSAPAPAPTAPPARTTSRPTAPVPAPTTGAAAPGPTRAPAQVTAAPSSLFDLDFRAPNPQSSKPQTTKADILSLYSTASAAPTANQPTSTNSYFSAPAPPIPGQNQYASWSGGITSSAAPTQQPTLPTQTNVGWGLEADQNAWGGFSGGSAAPAPAPQQSQGKTAQGNVMDPWGSQNGSAMDPWGTPATAPAVTTAGIQMGGMAGLGPAVQAKKEDPFANIWQ